MIQTRPHWITRLLRNHVIALWFGIAAVLVVAVAIGVGMGFTGWLS